MLYLCVRKQNSEVLYVHPLGVCPFVGPVSGFPYRLLPLACGFMDMNVSCSCRVGRPV